jgi:entericidin A
MKNIKKIMIVCILLSTVGALSACGTVHGFGRDVSHVGHDIQHVSH